MRGGAATRPLSKNAKLKLRRDARRNQQMTVVALSEYLERPLGYAWEDGRRGRQRWWGNLFRRIDELVASDSPPPFEVSMRMAKVLAWYIIDSYRDAGLAVDLPDPDPVQAALLDRRSA